MTIATDPCSAPPLVSEVSLRVLDARVAGRPSACHFVERAPVLCARAPGGCGVRAGEDGEHSRHGAARGSLQIESPRKGHERSAQIGEFPKRRNLSPPGAAPSIQPPHQHDIDRTPPRGIDQLLSQSALG